MSKYKRRNYLTDKSYQWRFAASVAGICAFGMSIALGAFNFLSYRRLESSLWRVHIDAASIGELIHPYLLYSNIAALGITALLLTVYSGFALIRNAPPLFRLKRYMEKAGEGNLTMGLDWILHDEFKETAKELDAMVEALRGKFAAVKENAENVERLSHSFHYVYERPDICAEKCRALISSLQSLKESLDKVRD